MGKARTSAKPVRLSATSNLHVLSSMPGKEKERPGQKDEGRAKKVDREKVGKARTSAEPVRLSATSNLHVPSSMPVKEKERHRRMGEGPRKRIKK